MPPALPASTGNEKDVASCHKKKFQLGQRARPALAPMIPEHRRGTDHFRPTYVENLFATCERHFNSRGPTRPGLSPRWQLCVRSETAVQ